MRTTFLALAICLSALTLNAATYYVDDSGSDANAGTISSPWRHIQYGVDQLAAGDQLYVRAGTYAEYVTVWGKTGTSAAPIYITAYPNELPVIDGTGTTSSNGVVVIGGDSAYIRFDGFDVRNGPNGGIYVYNANNLKIRWNEVHDNQSNGISVTSSSSSAIGRTHHVLVESNKVYRNVLNNSNRLETNTWQQALSCLKATYVDIIGNYVYENYGEGIDAIVSDYVNILGNKVYDNFSVNIYLDNAQYTKVDRNRIGCGWVTNATDYYRNSGPAIGIYAANEWYTTQNPLTDLTITNNLVERCRMGFGYSSSEYGGGLHNTVIANNAFYKSTDVLLYIPTDSNNVSDTTTVANNIFYCRTGQNYAWAPATGITYLTNNWYGGNANTHKAGTNDVMSDPLLVSAGGGDINDYKLTSTSPCINAGTTLSTAVPADYWQTARSGVYDIGLHEY
ncbi:MAG TPA: right-handed parallel beta-helix repeat-containing protein [Thermoanaerobaculia bacterium]|jgi:hypothetical protein